MKTKSWSFDHYCTYVLLCFASSDHELNEEELRTVQEFLNQSDLAGHLKLIQELNIVLKYQTEDEQLAFIEDKFSHYVENEEDFNTLVSCIEELIIADFQIAEKEMEFYKKIKKIGRATFS